MIPTDRATRKRCGACDLNTSASSHGARPRSIRRPSRLNCVLTVSILAILPSPSALADNTNGVTVRDGAVNPSAPAVPTVNRRQTADTTPTISGEANIGEGDTLTVELDNTYYTAGYSALVLNENGTWELTVDSDSPLTPGTYDVVVTVTDALGNQSVDMTTEDLIIDLTLPPAPTVASQTTDNTAPTVTGTAELGAGISLTVEVDGAVYGDGEGELATHPDGSWTLEIPTALEVGIYDVTATVSDTNDNAVTDGTVSELTIVAPDLDIDGEVVAEEGTPFPQLSGRTNAADGSAVIVRDEQGNTVCRVVVNAGAWSCAPEQPLREGSQRLLATITDDNGGSASASIDVEVLPAPGADFDGDGVADAVDLDDDNDGIPDTVEGARDTDEDGQPDSLDLDSDNDGIADIVEGQGEDADHDFRVDDFVDANANGLSDELEVLPLERVDSDGDRVADLRDLDSDNDGLTDLLESGGIDDDNDGRVDGFTDADTDGADDARQMAGPSGRDTDGDGIVNRLDLDSDNDGLTDAAESGAITDINDGITDPMRDGDGDGIPDSVDVDLTAGVDVDMDGIDDQFDASVLLGDDTDTDGIIDSADPDANGDGFADDPNNVLGSGGSLPDQNNNGVADVLEGQGGILRSGLDGYAGCSTGGPVGDNKATDPLLALLGVTALIGFFGRRRTSRQVARRRR